MIKVLVDTVGYLHARGIVSAKSTTGGRAGGRGGGAFFVRWRQEGLTGRAGRVADWLTDWSLFRGSWSLAGCVLHSLIRGWLAARRSLFDRVCIRFLLGVKGDRGSR